MNLKSRFKPYLLNILGELIKDESPKIVYYHDLIGVEKTRMATPFELFQSHIEFCKDNGWVIAKCLPQKKKEILVFLDDGFRGIWDHHEWLINEGVFPVTSVAIGKIGRPGYLTWEQIGILHTLGFNFISHTCSHKSLTECSEEELFHELRDSRKLLSEKLQEDVTSICFPRGLFSNKVLAASIESGYTIGFSSIPGNVGHMKCFGDKLTIYPRNLVQTSTLPEFRGILNGALNIFHRHYKNQHFINS